MRFGLVEQGGLQIGHGGVEPICGIAFDQTDGRAFWGATAIASGDAALDVIATETPAVAASSRRRARSALAAASSSAASFSPVVSTAPVSSDTP